MVGSLGYYPLLDRYASYRIGNLLLCRREILLAEGVYESLKMKLALRYANDSTLITTTKQKEEAVIKEIDSQNAIVNKLKK